MTIHTMQTPFREMIMTAALLLLLAQGYLCLAMIRNKRGGKLEAFGLIHLILTFGVFYILLYGADYPDAAMATGTFSKALLVRIYSLPVIAVILYEAVSVLVTVYLFCLLIRFQKMHPSAGAIKETIDLLPAGIAFADKDGKILLTNVTMNTITRTLTGKAMTDIHTLRDKDKLILPDYSGVWQLDREGIREDGDAYTQLTATDITEQSRINDELREKNDKLREMHMRLDIYNKQAERMIIEKELLNARMQVHNSTGHVLLSLRHYLDHPEGIEEDALLQMLKNNNAFFLKEYEEDDSGRDPLTDAVEMAEAIGVSVTIKGMLPQDETSRSILASAVGECATNTIKHADGNSIEVLIRKEQDTLIYTLTGNGTPPMEGVKESGGLKNLRILVEGAHGRMHLMASPAVTLTITLPVPAGKRN